MRLNVQLYIDVSGSPINDPIYERIELFDYESIELTSSLQDIRDISKVFTDFSQEFSVPASKRNNGIFKHFYNPQITDGFDARIKQRGYISLNGITFRDGFIRLSEVDFKNTQPSAYKLTFFGSMVELKEIIGDDELVNLKGLEQYNHSYTESTVYSGLTVGLGLSGGSMIESSNRDVVYPAISASDRWYYDTSATDGEIPVKFKEGFSVNLYDPATTQPEGTYGINYIQLKPAIKVKHIISAIEETYSAITFSDDFFGNPEFDQLYMLLHNNKGVLTGTGDRRTYRVGSSDSDADFKFSSGTLGDLRPMETSTLGDPDDEGTLFPPVAIYYNLTLTVANITAGGAYTYDLYLLEDGQEIESWKGKSAADTFTSELRSNDNKVWGDLSYRIESETITSFEISLEIERVQEQGDDPSEGYFPPDFIDTAQYNTTILSQSFVENLIIREQLPKLKVLDFLKGIYNMFNLTSYVDDNGVIVVKKLDDYYNEGVDIDISEVIETDSYTVKRMNLFSNISFKFSEPSTFGIINQNEQQQDEFGDLSYELKNDNLIFDGNKYEIKLPFEKMFFDRLNDENTGSLIPFGSGWLVDKKQDEVITKPILFLNQNQAIDDTVYKIGFLNNLNLATYNRPSNTSTNQQSTINFGAEADEYDGVTVERSLFALNYQNYISNVFSKTTRLFSLKGRFDLGLLLSYNMNDRFFVKNTPYRINNIRTNLSTGETDLELITDFDVSPETVVDVTAPSVPTNLALDSNTNTSLTFSWTASTDNIAVTGYEIWIDGALFDTVAVTTQYTASGLTINTSYDVQVLAFDANNNKSALTAVVAMVTANISDTQAPTVPTNLTAGIITTTSIGVNWTASTDNVGVTGYTVYLDGVSQGTTATLGYNITGLTTGTSYAIAVDAFDAAGNKSRKSTALITSTL